MKTSTIKPAIYLLLLATFALGSAFTPMAESAGLEAFTQPPRWKKLGQRKVNRALDRDEILVTGREGAFTKLKFIVRRSPINMHRCVIHFRNGDTQEVALRNNIPAGGETRVIDLEGNRRIITKVVFWYDTKGLQDKAVLELWGRH
ncbi:MAG: hypothetical protein KDD01_06365 [Phaeodactylibacter sp.]|nr:hypothetical protein [Phaeodactylibacter sp.]